MSLTFDVLLQLEEIQLETCESEQAEKLRDLVTAG